MLTAVCYGLSREMDVPNLTLSICSFRFFFLLEFLASVVFFSSSFFCLYFFVIYCLTPFLTWAVYDCVCVCVTFFLSQNFNTLSRKIFSPFCASLWQQHRIGVCHSPLSYLAHKYKSNTNRFNANTKTILLGSTIQTTKTNSMCTTTTTNSQQQQQKRGK